MAEVRIEHVFKRFGKVTAVNDFDLVVNDGEFVSILGPSGCGKTTTLRMIAGFERATEGEIFIGDNMVSSSKENTFVPPEDRNIGMVFQSYAVWPHMNVFDNVAYPLKIQKVPKEERKERVLHALGLVHLDEYAERLPSQLSGGQQQRVALARALVAHPGLLLLDEPLSNLDAKLRESMRFEILQLQKQLAITVVYVTHDQGEAMAMSDKVVVMNKGNVQQIGAPYEIYTKPANKMVADFIGLVNFLPGEVKGDRVHIDGIEGSFATGENISGKATIAVRPENITMSKTKGLVSGKITGHFYLGDSVDYRVQVGEYKMRVITKGTDIKSFVDGDTVFLDFEDVLVFENNEL
jgi:iron(III) transport system ATP-binding protein